MAQHAAGAPSGAQAGERVWIALTRRGGVSLALPWQTPLLGVLAQGADAVALAARVRAAAGPLNAVPAELFATIGLRVVPEGGVGRPWGWPRVIPAALKGGCAPLGLGEYVADPSRGVLLLSPEQARAGDLGPLAAAAAAAGATAPDPGADDPNWWGTLHDTLAARTAPAPRTPPVPAGSPAVLDRLRAFGRAAAALGEEACVALVAGREHADEALVAPTGSYETALHGELTLPDGHVRHLASCPGRLRPGLVPFFGREDEMFGAPLRPLPATLHPETLRALTSAGPGAVGAGARAAGLPLVPGRVFRRGTRHTWLTTAELTVLAPRLAPAFPGGGSDQHVQALVALLQNAEARTGGVGRVVVAMSYD